MFRRTAAWLRRLVRGLVRQVHAAAPPGAPDYRIECTHPSDAAKPVFIATGTLADCGVVEGQSLPVGQGRRSWVGNRTLRGRTGVLFLMVDAHYERGGASVAHGSFEIVGGTGAFANAEGSGTYEASTDPAGRLVETFTALPNTAGMNPERATRGTAPRGRAPR